MGRSLFRVVDVLGVRVIGLQLQIHLLVRFLLGLAEAVFVPHTRILLLSRSHRQSTELFRILVDFYLRGLLDLDTIVAETIPLEQVNDGFERMKKGDAARSVIVFD